MHNGGSKCLILLKFLQDIAYSSKPCSVKNSNKGGFLIRRVLEGDVLWPSHSLTVCKFLHRVPPGDFTEMKRLLSAGYLIVTLGLLGLALPVKAQPSRNAIRMIRETVDETKLVELEGNTRPEATAANDRGAVSS